MPAARYAFLTEWLDPNSGYLWKYQLFFYPETNEVEMNDIKNNKVFLRRVRYEDLRVEQLFLGNPVTVYGRQLKLVEYGDDFTRAALEPRSEKTLGLVKPDAIQHLGKIVHAVQQAGFKLGAMKMCRLSKAEAEAFYAEHRGRPFFEKLTAFMSSGRVLAMELVAPGAIAKWRNLIGPTDSNQARAQAPSSLRAHFGTDTTYNATHGSDSPASAARELGFFFSRPVGRCLLGQGTTLGLIKPQLLRDGAAGLALDVIMDKFAITALTMLSMTPIEAAELYEVYKGVLAPGEFSAVTEEVASGPAIAIEVADKSGQPSGHVVEAFRELCGPIDADIARALRPKSLRAMFGDSKVKNGLHCTDLAEDGELEVNYAFNVLAR